MNINKTNIQIKDNQSNIDKLRQLKMADMDIEIGTLTRDILKKKEVDILSNTHLKVLAKELSQLSSREFDTAKSMYLYIYEV